MRFSLGDLSQKSSQMGREGDRSPESLGVPGMALMIGDRAHAPERETERDREKGHA